MENVATGGAEGFGSAWPSGLARAAGANDSPASPWPVRLRKVR